MPTQTRSRYLAIPVALVLASGGGYLAYQQFGPQPATAAAVTTAPATQGSIAATISATGSVASPAQSNLSFKSGGRVTRLLVAVGDQVAEGQPLAGLDAADLQVALLEARSAYDSAVAKLELTKVGSRPEEIATAQAQLDSARVLLAQKQAGPRSPEVAAAQIQVESARIKLEQTTTPRAEDIISAQATLAAAEARLAAALTPRAEDVASTQSQLDSAQIKLEQTTTPRAEDVRDAEMAVVSAEAKLRGLQQPRPEELSSLQAALDQAQTKLAQYRDQPKTAMPQELGNAELAVDDAQVAYDKALGKVKDVSDAKGSTYTSADADAAVKQALIGVQRAQNSLQKLKEQGPSEWEIRQQEQAVTRARADLDKVKTPSPTEVQQAQAALGQARVALEKTRTPSAYDVQQAQESVTQARAAADKLLAPAASDVASARQAVTEAQTALAKLVQPDAYDVRTAQAAVREAQAKLDQLAVTNGYDVQTAAASVRQLQATLDLKRAGSTAQAVAQDQAGVDQAAARLRQAETNLDAATLVAPFPGVVAALGVNLGEQTGSGASTSTASSTVGGAVTLLDTRQVRVDLVVDEVDIARVRPDQEVTLTFDALPGAMIAGRVGVLAPTAVTSNGVVTYQVQVQVDPERAQAAGVRSGMTAGGAIVTAKKDDAVLVPSRFVKIQGPARTLEVLDAGGRAATRSVQTGIAGDQNTEILGGLLPGDLIVTSGARVAVAVPAPAGGGPGAGAGPTGEGDGGGPFGGP